MSESGNRNSSGIVQEKMPMSTIMKRNSVDAMLIRMPEGYSTFEIEVVSFLGDRMILMFNENLADEDNTLMIEVWQDSGE